VSDPVPPRRRRVLAGTAAFVALGAYGGAAGLAFGFLDMGDRLNGRLPFGSPVLGGIALLLVVALPFTDVARRAGTADPRTDLSAFVAGGLMVGWIAVEVAFIREFSALQVVYGGFGVAFMVVGRHSIDGLTLRHRSPQHL
jgi:hypothetical protein